MECPVTETLPPSGDDHEDVVIAQNSELCRSCRRIDFQAVFALTRAEVGVLGKPITKTIKKLRSGCTLCSWISSELGRDAKLHAGQSCVKEAGCHLRALDSLSVSKVIRSEGHKAASPSIVIAVFACPIKDITSYKVRIATDKSLLVILPLTCGLSGSDMPKSTYEGRSVSAKHPDFDLMASWIRDCLVKHKAKCKRKSSKINFSTRVIDCEKRKIVPLTEDMQYLALSYVWGKGTQESAEQQEIGDCGLPTSVPRAIEDAMSVVLKLKKRYLWVDRYCIWTSEDKHTQLQNIISGRSDHHSGSGCQGCIDRSARGLDYEE